MYYMFYNYYPIENISIADFGLLIMIYKGFKNGVEIKQKDIRIVSILLVGLGILGLLAFPKPHFVLATYINNLIRIVFYCTAFLVISWTIKSGDTKVLNGLKKSFYVLFVAVSLEVLLQYFNVYYSYFIPFLTRNTSRQFQSFRPSAFFDEPSYLSIYLVLSYYMVSQSGAKGVVWRAMVVLTVLLSQSLAGLAGLSWVLYTDNLIWAKYKRIKPLAALPLIVGLVVSSSVLVERIQEIAMGADGSATHRIMGSLEVSMELLRNHFYTGIGLGQFKAWLSNGNVYFESHFFLKKMGTGSGINNALLMALGISGITGVVSYLWFFLSISRKFSYIVLLLWLSFSWGFIFHPFLFLFFAVIHGVRIKEQ